ncbi:hypothetical protein PGB90_010003 [Kerria lacca]
MNIIATLMKVVNLERLVTINNSEVMDRIGISREIWGSYSEKKSYSERPPDEKSSVEVIGTISDLTVYIRNTVTFQNYENIHGPTTASQLLQKFQNDLIEITGSKSANDAEMKIIFNFILLLGRKPF